MVRLFRVFIPVVTILLLISETLLVAGAFVAAAFLELPDPYPYFVERSGILSVGIVVLTIVMGFYLGDLYTDIRINSPILLVQRLCFVMGAAFLLQALISYVDRDLRIPLHVMLPGSALALAFIFGWRLLFNTRAMQVMGGERLLLLGGSDLLATIAGHLEEHPEKGVRVMGFLGDDESEMVSAGKHLGPVEALREVAEAMHPTRIVVGMRERRQRVPVTDLLELRFQGQLVEEAATAYERILGRLPVRDLRPSALIYSGQLGPRRKTLLYQSVGNYVVAAIGLILASPLMLLTALAVRLTSPGPILYRQSRVGRGDKPFTVYKFRSMRVDAEKHTGAVWAVKNDPRITPVGRVIRKIRFDELPQLCNVLKGDMAIVGPRPERPEFVKTLSEQIPYYRQRHAVRPGITGWAQINYKYGDTLEDTMVKLEYDLYYVKHMSFSLDLYITFHTVKAMLLSRGAQ